MNERSFIVKSNPGFVLVLASRQNELFPHAPVLNSPSEDTESPRFQKVRETGPGFANTRDASATRPLALPQKQNLRI
jgi:hypothetical protein